jgi:hypothetical protein
MEIFDLAIAFVWEYDREFVQLIEEQFQEANLKTFLIEKHNLLEVYESINSGHLSFSAFLDRASDEDIDFLPLTKLLTSKNCFIINPHFKVVKSIDKASMHKRIMETNLCLPRTILIPSFEKQKEYSVPRNELREIGIPFIIKPALTSGGGQGVIKDAETYNEIDTVRQKNIKEKYLLQEKIYPKVIHSKRAWFRVIYAFGNSIPTWWDDLTHVYFRVTNFELKKYNLNSLYTISKKLARITQLDYFSTEIALTNDYKFYVIDYINDQCDMRLKSNHPDGVPDEVVEEFIENMKKKVLKIKNSYPLR